MEPTDRAPRHALASESADVYRALFEHYTEAVFLYDAASRRILFANPAFHGLIGHSPDALPDLTAYDVVGHSRQEIDAAIAQTPSEGSAAIGRRLWKRRDGVLVDVYVSLGRFQHGGREILFSVGRRSADVVERSSLGAVVPVRRARARGAGPVTRLSRREVEVLRLLAQGFSNRQVGLRLEVSVKTVETYRTRLFKKLGLRGRPALVRYALRAGLLAADALAPDPTDAESERRA